MILPPHAALLLARERMADDHRRTDQSRRVSEARPLRHAPRARQCLRALARRPAWTRAEVVTHLP